MIHKHVSSLITFEFSQLESSWGFYYVGIYSVKNTNALNAMPSTIFGEITIIQKFGLNAYKQT